MHEKIRVYLPSGISGILLQLLSLMILSSCQQRYRHVKKVYVGQTAKTTSHKAEAVVGKDTMKTSPENPVFHEVLTPSPVQNSSVHSKEKEYARSGNKEYRSIIPQKEIRIPVDSTHKSRNQTTPKKKNFYANDDYLAIAVFILVFVSIITLASLLLLAVFTGFIFTAPVMAGAFTELALVIYSSAILLSLMLGGFIIKARYLPDMRIGRLIKLFAIGISSFLLVSFVLSLLTPFGGLLLIGVYALCLIYIKRWKQHKM